MLRASSALLASLVACAGGPVADTAASGADGGAPDSADTGAEGVCAVVSPPLHGCQVTEWVDPDADGYYPDVRRTLYDGEGRVSSWDERSGLDPGEFTVCGNDWHTGAWLDREWCAGDATYTYTWSYDALDHPAGKVYDAGSDGVPDKEWRFETDAEGRITAELQDQDLDGETDSLTRYTWGPDGQIAEEQWDYTADGSVDYARAWTYDEAGRVVLLRIDEDGDGTWDRHTTTTRAADGRPLREETDLDGDGSAEATVTWSYTDCVLDTVSTTEDGGVRGVSRYWWDDDGRVSRVVEDFNDDGDPDTERWFTYACP